VKLAKITGTNNSETKYGTSSADLIYGYGGNDSLYGRAGDDQIWGGLGSDKLFGESGIDTLRGEDGSDLIYGGDSGDWVYGGIGNDTLHGDGGDDYVYGGLGFDNLFGEAGNDVLWGEDGNDIIRASDGNDAISGGIGDDTLYGDAGIDSMFGDAGNDTLNGGRGVSTLYGADGNDTLFFNPTSGDISTLKSPTWGPNPGGAIGGLPPISTLNGDAGFDTLNITNETTYNKDGITKPSMTQVIMTDSGNNGGINFYEQTSLLLSNINAADFQSIEKITVTGTGGLYFYGYPNKSLAKGIDITGTNGADQFSSYYADDTMRGGGGNDWFYSSGGNDKIVSLLTDADEFYFSQFFEFMPGTSTVTGFNGAGVSGGDRLYLQYYNTAFTPYEFDVYESNGSTHFEVTPLWDQYNGPPLNVTVDAIGLVPGVDYFFPV
jgi:hypothetical protein